MDEGFDLSRGSLLSRRTMNDDIVCLECGSTGPFSKRQHKRALEGKGARCIACIEQTDTKPAAVPHDKHEQEAPTNGETLDEVPHAAQNKHIVFSDGEAEFSAEENNSHGDDSSGAVYKKDKADVSVADLKQQILGRQIQTASDDDDDEVRLNSHPQATNLVNTTASAALKDDLTCVICHAIVFQPVSLTCGHSFCRSCVRWWYSSADQPRTDCPTCRTALPIPADRLQVNRALAAVVELLYSEEIAQRRLTERSTKAGEAGGAHDGGYQVLAAVEQEGYVVVRSSARKGTVSARRSIILDANDQRMQLALALRRAPTLSIDDQGRLSRLQVDVCLITMEEDEVEDGMPLVLDEENDDDEHLICSADDRFQATHLEVTALGVDNHDKLPVERRELVAREGGVLSFELDMTARHLSRATVLSFRHDETGAELQLQIGQKGPGAARDKPTAQVPQRTGRGESLEVDMSRHDDEEDEDDELDEFEDDGFVVGDEDDDFDACHVCGDGGELIVCDAGDHRADSCGRSFHVHCIGREQVPDGDWICQDCAVEQDYRVGKEGHEFVAESAEKPLPRKRTIVLDDSDEEGDNGKQDDESLLATLPNKRRVILDSDDDD